MAVAAAVIPIGLAQLDAPGRVRGVDLARGLAVLGMFAAHLLTIAPFDASDPETWIAVAQGRASILFAVLAGVAISLVTGGIRPAAGAALANARRRLVVRAVLVWTIGALLIATGVPVFVILPAYALLFLIAVPLLAMPRWALWAIAAALAFVMPWVLPALDALPVWQGVEGHDVALIVGWHYPFPLWSAFLIAGMALGRYELRAPRTALSLAVGGALAIVAAGAASLLLAGVVSADADGYLSAVLSSEAHSGGLIEVIGSAGAAVVTIGGSQLICLGLARAPLPWAGWATVPLRAVGAMPLTAYAGQLLAWAFWAQLALGDTGDLTGLRALDPFWPFVLTTLALCTLWALTFGRGPLERLVASAARLVAPR
ncbi:MAG: heparan-alpha-glucosaminide N-acetyltransferase domain-containing protein [Microbacterium sp.]